MTCCTVGFGVCNYNVLIGVVLFQFISFDATTTASDAQTYAIVGTSAILFHKLAET